MHRMDNTRSLSHCPVGVSVGLQVADAIFRYGDFAALKKENPQLLAFAEGLK